MKLAGLLCRATWRRFLSLGERVPGHTAAAAPSESCAHGLSSRLQQLQPVSLCSAHWSGKQQAGSSLLSQPQFWLWTGEASFSGLFWYWLEGTTLRECLSMCVYRQSMHATRSAFDFRPRRRSSWRIHNHTRIREWKKDGKWLRRWSFRI